MLPVWDRPSIHLTVEEAVRAGIEHVIFVLAHGQEAIGRYFDRLPELEQAWRAGVRRHAPADGGDNRDGRDQLRLPGAAARSRSCGAHRARCRGRRAVRRPLPDDLIFSAAPTIVRMIDLFAERRSAVIAVAETPDEMVPAKGIVDAKPVDDRCSRSSVWSRTGPEDAPSNLGIVGRYVLPPEVFDALDSTRPSAGGEIWLTDAIAALLTTGKGYAYRFRAYTSMWARRRDSSGRRCTLPCSRKTAPRTSGSGCASRSTGSLPTADR